MTGARVAVDADQSRCGELLDLGSRLAVQMKGNAVAICFGLVAPPHDGGVVASDLGGPGPRWCGPVEIFQDQGLDRMCAMVHSDRENVDEEGVLLRRTQSQLRRASQQQWPDVHGGGRSMRGYVFSVETDGQMDALLEEIQGHHWDADARRAVLHALRILPGSKDVDGAVAGRPKRLESFVALLAVVQARGETVDAQQGILDESGSCPLAGLGGVVGFDVAVDLSDPESDIVPVCGC